MLIDTDLIWSWLAEIPDPEIPIISIVDLGIIRAVEWQDLTCVVTVTPTYSGCPAVAVINDSIVDMLNQHGVTDIRLKTQISPAWNTDWLSESAKQKLKGYGIAPPVQQTIDISRLDRNNRSAISSRIGGIQTSEPKVVCPNCDSTSTTCISQFGSTPCKAHYKCNSCLEPFDYFKCH